MLTEIEIYHIELFICSQNNCAHQLLLLPISQLSRQGARPAAELCIVPIGAILSLDYQLAVGKERVVRTVLKLRKIILKWF